MSQKNPNNNPLLYLIGGSDPYKVQEEWRRFAEQGTIVVVNQAMAIVEGEITVALWYIWKE